MFHPFLYTLARVGARRQVRAMGHRLSTVNEALSEIGNDAIDAEMDAHGVTFEVLASYAPSGMVGGFGDGSIIAAIIEFFKSPRGQAIIDAIVKMILALIAGLMVLASQPVGFGFSDLTRFLDVIGAIKDKAPSLEQLQEVVNQLQDLAFDIQRKLTPTAAAQMPVGGSGLTVMPETVEELDTFNQRLNDKLQAASSWFVNDVIKRVCQAEYLEGKNFPAFKEAVLKRLT